MQITRLQATVDSNHRRLAQTPLVDSMLASDLVCHYLSTLNVPWVFGVPGGSLEPFYDALARSDRRNGPRAVIARHESGAAFMAAGFSRETGKLGVCCATTGPGATNMLTGVACAYQDGLPLLALSAQTALRHFGRGPVQESSCTGINTHAIYNTCTRYNSFVSHVDQLESKLVAAIHAAMRPPQGPAHLTIPLDIWRQSVLRHGLEQGLLHLVETAALIDRERLDWLVGETIRARKVCVLVGDHVARSIHKITEFSRTAHALIVTVPQAHGFVDANESGYCGVFGLAGHRSAVELLADPELDLIIAAGTSFDEQATNGWDDTLLTKKLVHIDCHAEHFYRSVKSQSHIQGDLLASFTYLQSELRREISTCGPMEVAQRQPYRPPSGTDMSCSTTPLVSSAIHQRLVDRINHLPFTVDDKNKATDLSQPIKPQALMVAISDVFPENTRYLADIGNSFLWAIHYLQPRIVSRDIAADWFGGTLRVGMGFASMGWAIGAAVGTALAAVNIPVVCITGDGSMLMVGQELTVAVEEELPVIYVVLNDSAYGTVKHGQQISGAEPIGFRLPQVAFDRVAQAMGAEGVRITSLLEWYHLDVSAMLRRRGPTVLDVQIDPDEVPPLATRLRALTGDGERLIAG